jgi:hypothetical protein
MLMQRGEEGAVELEGGVFDAFEAAEGVAHAAEEFAGALDEEDLQTLVGFEVHELDGDDFFEEFVLEIGDAVLKVAALMFVYEGEYAHHDGVIVAGVEGVDGFGDNAGNGLGAVRKPAAFGETVEAGKGFIGNADGDTAEGLGHDMTF